MLARGVSVRDDAGKITCWAGINLDINYLVKTETALHESEAYLKVAKAVEAERQLFLDMLETLPIIICLLTSDYRVTFVNRNCREQFGDSVGLYCYEYRFGLTNRCEFCETYKVLETGQPQHWEYNDMDGRVIDTYDFPFTDVDSSLMILKMGIDITEHKKAEEKIRLANIYNRSLIEASLDPLVTIGHDGKITDVNASTEFVTGYSRNELIGTDFMNYFTEPEKSKEVYQEVFKEGFVSDYALEIQHKNGKITPVLYNASIYQDESGEVIGVFAAARDITERKRIETELESIARLLQENPNPVIRLSEGRIITYANSAAKILLSCWGSTINQKAPPEIADVAVAALDDGTQHKFECNYANNTYFINITPFPQADYVNLYARDITDFKDAEKALKDSENKYRTLFEFIDEGFCIIEMIFDANGRLMDYRFLETNPAFEKQTGLHEATGETMREFVPDHEEHWFETYGTIALTGEPKRFVNEAKSLMGGWYEVYAFRVGAQESNKVAILFNDITTRKKTDEMLKSNVEELACSNEELEQFAYVSSHDLQEPLRMITSYLQLLQRKYQGNLDDKADKYIHFAIDGASRMQNLINDLLEYSRVTRSAREAKTTNCEFILNQALSNLKLMIKNNKVTISHDPLPYVMADPT